MNPRAIEDTQTLNGREKLHYTDYINNLSIKTFVQKRISKLDKHAIDGAFLLKI